MIMTIVAMISMLAAMTVTMLQSPCWGQVLQERHMRIAIYASHTLLVAVCGAV